MTKRSEPLFLGEPSGIITGPVVITSKPSTRPDRPPRPRNFSPLQWLVRPPRQPLFRPLFFLFDVLCSLVLGCLYRLSDIQPVDARFGVARAVAWLIRWPIQRPILRRLRLIFADEPRDEAKLRGLWREFLQQVTMSLVQPRRFARMSDEQLRQQIQIEGEEHLRAALAQGRGVVLFTNHMAECGATPSLGRFGYDMTIVSDPLPVAYLERAYDRWYRALNTTRLVAGDHGASQTRRVLERNGVVALYTDLSMTKRHGEWVPFGGQAEIRLHPGPALVALRAQAPILYATALRLPDYRIRLSISEPLHCDPNADVRENVRGLLEQSAELLHCAVRANPSQWWALDFVELRPAKKFRHAADA